MKLTDYLAETLADHGVKHVFGLTGGAVVHLFDSAAQTGRIEPIFHHHEQAAAFAAQANARITENLGVCFVTTGPGVTNAITGLAAAWLDSVPCLFVSGQTRVAHTTRHKRIRQLGTQELDVIPLVESLTKSAVMVEKAEDFPYELGRALHLATSGRPGPVWIDLPLDLQWTEIDPLTCRHYDPAEDATTAELVLEPATESIDTLTTWIAQAERPLLLAGYGVVRSGARDKFARLVEETQLPFVTTWGAIDVMPSGHPLNLGRPGVAGQRGANLAVQNCDLLIAVGSHLNIPVTGTMFDAFARTAKVVVVDIDPDELAERTVPVHLPVQADAGRFLDRLITRAPFAAPASRGAWMAACERYRDYLQPPAPTEGEISPYDYVRTLSNLSAEDDLIVVDGGGTNVYTSFQTFELKGRQRMYLSTALCSMGSGFPESIGICIGGERRRTICLCGDGSAQLNIQELQTILHHQLPVKIFISDNRGYMSIRHTQSEFLGARYTGSQASGGVSLPDYTKVAAAYGLPVFEITERGQLTDGLAAALAAPGPSLCVVHTAPNQEITPRQGFRQREDGTFAARPLEDMAPLLERREFAEAMMIPTWDDSPAPVPAPVASTNA